MRAQLRTILSYIDLVTGCHDSSFSTCPWFEWCVLWLILQPWYGTRMELCTMLPTRSLIFRLLEKLWCPLQCCQDTLSASKHCQWLALQW